MTSRSEGASASRRARASLACDACRQRKIKCDAQSICPPEPCSTCRRTGRHCVIDPTADRRRAVSRQYIHDLQQRIIELESATEPAAPLDFSHTLNEAFSSADGPTPDHFDFAEPLVPQVQDSPHLRANGHNQINPDIVNCVEVNKPESRGEDEYPFFGRTSQAHVGSPVAEDWGSASSPRTSPDILIDSSSVQLRDHLLASYFKYQSLWVEIVDKNNFENARLARYSRWHSDFLENAMLASATRLSTSKAVRALGPEFARLARADMSMALDDPSPASLQGFLILSEFEVTRGQDRIGWMLCGMACRLIPDLGLHDFEDTLSNGLKRLELTPSSKRDLFYPLCCACVVYETVWSLYLGRPSSITRAVIDAVSNRCKEQRPTDSPQLNAWVGLCIPTLEVSRILNSGESIQPGDSSVLVQLNHELEDWYERLPPSLSYENKHIGGLDVTGYGLHTQYCKLQMLINQAMNPAHDRRRRSSTTTVSHTETFDEGKHYLVQKHATCVAHLVLTYREMYGADKIPSIMLDNAILAATCLKEGVSYQHFQPDGRDRNTKTLRSLIGVLEEVEPHFPITKRMVDTLKEQPNSDGPKGTTTSTAIDKAYGLEAQSEVEFQFSTPNHMVQMYPDFDDESWSGIFDENMSSDHGLWDSIEKAMPGVSPLGTAS